MNNKYVVEITNPQGAITCDNLMHPYRMKKEPLTPEFCISLLQMSNNRKNIRDMLKLVSEHLTEKPESYPEYRKVLYGVISNREQPEEILERVAEISQAFTNMEKVDKLDRAFINDLSKTGLSNATKEKTEKLAGKILKKVPVDVDDLAENMVRDMLEEKVRKKNIDHVADSLTAYALAEIPEKSCKRNFFSRLYNKIKSR